MSADRVMGSMSEAEKVPAAIVARLGMEIADLENLHAALTQVIAAAREG